MLWVLLLGTSNDSEVFESGLVYKIGLWWISLVEIDICIYGLLCLANKKVQEKLDGLKKKKKKERNFSSILQFFFLSDVDFFIIKVANVAFWSSN